MVTMCTECGEQFDYWFDFIEGFVALRHLKSEHPSVYSMFQDGGSERVSGYARLPDGTELHLIGDVIEYERDDGTKVFQIGG